MPSFRSTVLPWDRGVGYWRRPPPACLRSSRLPRRSRTAGSRTPPTRRGRTQWTDSVYNDVTDEGEGDGEGQSGSSFTLAWTTVGQDNAADAPTASAPSPSRRRTSGLINTDWSTNPPPTRFPILCAQIGGCNNSLASTYYNSSGAAVRRCSRSRCSRARSWTSTGGAQNDVRARTTMSAPRRSPCPRSRRPSPRAKVRTRDHAGRRARRPVRERRAHDLVGLRRRSREDRFRARGRLGAPVTTAVLRRTNQTPKPPPADTNYFPLEAGAEGDVPVDEHEHLKKPSCEAFTSTRSSNGTARFR